MSETLKSNRGGKREGAGRKPNAPDVTDLKIGKGFATRVFGRIKELQLKDALGHEIKSADDYALMMLSSQDAEAKAFFKLLLAYQLGKPVQPTMQADTRETAPELDFGDLIMPAPGAAKPGTAGKPN
jgi:hypothetical protein